MQSVENLIEENRKLIYSVAHRTFPEMAKDEDLLQCGMIGLWKAAENWDGVRPFPPFACTCIRNAMRNHLRDTNKGPFTTPLEECDELGLAQAAPEESALTLFSPGSLEYQTAELLSHGYRKREIAAMLKRHPKTVTRICRRIRERIEQE